MRQLIDTHVFIWYVRGDERLSQSAKDAIEHPDADNLVSIASLWEMAVKTSLGKLDLGKPFDQVYIDLDNNGFQVLPIEFAHLKQVSALPFLHRDPFDRLLIAQALVEKISLISADDSMGQYSLDLIW
jgi:PIN domain nuclease of toxin-antitoxin system